MTSPDLFTLPHKALRAWVGNTATALGGLDIRDLNPVAAVIADLRLVLTDLEDHGHHENGFIVPVLERHVADLADLLRGEHFVLESAIAALRTMVDDFEVQPSPKSQLSLYRELRNFEGRNLAHLDFEETVVMPALWKAVTADELIAAFQAFKAAHPDSDELYQRVPDAITPQERILVFA